VWSILFENLKKNPQYEVTAFLNKEHWHHDYPKLRITKPSNYLRLSFSGIDQLFLVRLLRYLIGVSLDILYSPIFLIFLFRELQKFKGQIFVIHNGGWPGGQITKYVLLVAKFLHSQKIIFVIHSYTNSYLPEPIFYIQRKVLKYLIRYIDPLVVTVSNDLKLHIDHELNVNSVMIWNGIRSETGISSKSDKSLFKVNLPIIGFVASFIESKGSLFLVDVINDISAPCNLLIVGNYKDKDKSSFLKQIVNEKCEVVFYGFAEDTSRLYKKFDIFISCAQELESFGLTACEAMLHKLPVICTNAGGMKEVVVDNFTGYVVEKSDSRYFAEKIDFLIANPSKRKEMGQIGYERYMSNFTSEIMTKNYLDLL
jgi:glycosyltransferase involved in cell wall biosynthesis